VIRRLIRRRRAAEDRRTRAFVWAIRESAIPGHVVGASW